MQLLKEYVDSVSYLQERMKPPSSHPTVALFHDNLEYWDTYPPDKIVI